MNIFLSLVLFISQIIYFDPSGMPSEHYFQPRSQNFFLAFWIYDDAAKETILSQRSHFIKKHKRTLGTRMHYFIIWWTIQIWFIIRHATRVFSSFNLQFDEWISRIFLPKTNHSRTFFASASFWSYY